MMKESKVQIDKIYSYYPFMMRRKIKIHVLELK